MESPSRSLVGTRITAGVFVSLALIYVIWSSTYLALRYMVEELPAFISSGARYLTAGTVLLLVLLARKSPFPNAREWMASAPGGFLLFVLGNGFVAFSERNGVSSSVAAVAIGIMPLIATALAMHSGERPSRRQWLGLTLGFSGLLVMGLGDLRATPLGLVALLVAASGWAVGTHLTRRLPLPKGLMAAATQMLLGGVFMILSGTLFGERFPSHVLDLPWRVIASFFYLVVFGSLIAFSAYTYLLRNTTASVATSYAYVNPLLAVVMGIVIGKEHVASSTVIAALFVVIGVAFIITEKKERTVTASLPTRRTPHPQEVR